MMTPETIAKRARSAAKAIMRGKLRGHFGDRKVFIASVWARMRVNANKREDYDFLSLDEFKDALVKANQRGLIQLHRADLVQEMPSDLVTASETHYMGARFHFIGVPIGGKGARRRTPLRKISLLKRRRTYRSRLR